MKIIDLILVTIATLVAMPAFAAIPVKDAAQLTQHAKTASTTVKLVPISTERENTSSGVHCAVTTGKKASIIDPTVKPQDGAGSQEIHAYASDLPPMPDPAAKGATLNIETLFKSSGDVAAGSDASRSTLAAVQSGFKAAGQQVGTASTVMAAIDMNSAARLQNSFAWNNVINSANLWVTALNALNLAMTGDTSSAAMAMRASTSGSEPGNHPICQTGADRFCQAPPGCSIAPPGSASAPGCVSPRYVDTDADDALYLQQAENAAKSHSTSTDRDLTTADVTTVIDAGSR